MSSWIIRIWISHIVGQSDLSSRIQNGYINGIYYDITYQSDDYNGLYLAMVLQSPTGFARSGQIIHWINPSSTGSSQAIFSGVGVFIGVWKPYLLENVGAREPTFLLCVSFGNGTLADIVHMVRFVRLLAWLVGVKKVGQIHQEWWAVINHICVLQSFLTIIIFWHVFVL